MTPIIFLCIILQFLNVRSEEVNLQDNFIVPDYVNTAETTVEGILVGAMTELATISLTSLQQTNIACGSASSVAFNWKSRTVYWTELDTRKGVGIKRANLDSTDVEHLVQVQSAALAVDSMTGNIYFQNFTSLDLRVCDRNVNKCSIIATNQFAMSDIALHPTKSLMFWTNSTGVVRANMDGTDATVILKETVLSIAVDDTDRLYWIDDSEKYIASCSLNGNDQRVLLNATTRKLSGVAVHAGLVYFNNFASNSIQSVSKHGGVPAVVVNTTSFVNHIALYGTKGGLSENPCAGSPCSHLCVLKYDSLACLCPEGQRLDHDGTTCIHLQKQIV